MLAGYNNAQLQLISTGNTLNCEYGNGLSTTYQYNPFGLLTRIHTGVIKSSTTPENGLKFDDLELEKGIAPKPLTDSAILNYRYAYNNCALMTSRSEKISNEWETFTYDNLDRLSGITNGATGTENITYKPNGNMSTNSILGDYSYSNKPHAVTRVGATSAIKRGTAIVNECVVAYNFFNQPTEITDWNYRLNLTYGADQQRLQTERYRNDTLVSTRSYFNQYSDHEDYKTDSLWFRRFNNYIYGDNGVVAMNIQTIISNDSIGVGTVPGDSAIVLGETFRGQVGTTDSMYYIHTDHLGSYCAITNSAKVVRQRNFFNPWGNPIDTCWQTHFAITFRGFTGHEHYPYLGIINMNGRLYDPLIGRFFSPDKYVANSTFTQDFNRYSYCRNNPLMYSDPDGELPWFVPIII